MVDKIKSLLGHIPKWLLSGVTLALILWLTLAPHPTGDVKITLFPGADKVVHGIMFGVLTLAICVDTMRFSGWKELSLPTIGMIALGSGFFGIIIELIQEKMGMGRTLEIMDMLADGAGAMIGAGIWAVLNKPFSEPEQ